jgi:hypothetical protein
MSRLVRCLIISAAGVAFIAGIAGFAGRVSAGGVVDAVTTRPGPGPGPATGPGSVYGQPGGTGKGHGKCRPAHVYPPGHGFKPMRATNAELIAHGFPPRPPKSDGLALQLWRSVIVRARKFDRPHPVCGMRGRSTVYSGNWSGRVVPKSYYGGGAITAVQSEWVQPAVAGDPNYTNFDSAPSVSLWTGVGMADLMQAGVDSISTARPRYRFWTEDYPQKMIWEGPPIRAGQTAFVYIRNQGHHHASYFLENVTSGVYSSFSNPLPYIGYRTADFVLERPNGRYLPAFSALNVWDDYFWQHGILSQLTSASDRWIMTSNCGPGGTVLARASAVTGGQFTQSFARSRPFSNAC